jgi:hypothetical protein
MRARTLVLCCSLLCGSFALGSGRAAAQSSASEPTERTVVTKDGAMYRGEVLEYVVGSHITLKLDSGESKRIVWDDAQQISPPRPKAGGRAPSPPPSSPPPSSPPPSSPPPSSPPPSAAASTTGAGVIERTVLTNTGITLHGEVVEYEVSSHVVLKLATGETRRISWGEAKRISPPRPRFDPSPVGSPERTVILRGGATVRGELVESVLGDHTTLRLATGEIRRIGWNEALRILHPLPVGTRSPIPTTGELTVSLDTGTRVVGEFFEYLPDLHLILRHASGRLHVIPVAAIRKVVVSGDAQ